MPLILIFLAFGLYATPLTPRSGGGPMRFTELSPVHTGIDFQIKIDRDNLTAFFARDQMQGSGSGVAIGDVDGDGLPDLFLARAKGGSRLYRNMGHCAFTDVTSSSGINEADKWGTSATMVDYDNDGDLDIAVCGHRNPNRLYRNDGKGRFTEVAESAGLNFAGNSIAIAFADYDRDGDLDAYLLTGRYAPNGPPAQQVPISRDPRTGAFRVAESFAELVDVLPLPDGSPKTIWAGQRDHFYRNNGDGSFTDITRQAGIFGSHYGLGLVWWDFDDDGWPDIYVANDHYGPDKLYRNNRDGTFRDVTAFCLPHTPWFSMGCDIGDINNDGLMDLFATDMAGTTHYKDKMSMGGMDDFAWFRELPTPRQYMRNALYLNSGTPRFQEAAQLYGISASDWTWSPRFGDFDNDGRLDLFVTNGMARDWLNHDRMQDAHKLGPDDSPEFAAYWLKQPPRAEANRAWRNLGNHRMQDVGAAWGLSQESVSYGSALSDLDRDGDLDLVVLNLEAPASIYRNDSSDANSMLLRLRGLRNTWGIGAKVTVGDQIRYVSPVSGFASCNEALVHVGLGAQATAPVSVRWPNGKTQEFGILAANQLHELAESATAGVANSTAGRPMFMLDPARSGIQHRENVFDDYALQPLLPRRQSRLGPGMTIADLDGDGQADDLVLAGARGVHSQVAIDFKARNLPDDRMAEILGVLALDLDGDDDLDLYLSHGEDAGPRDTILINDGKAGFTQRPGPQLHDSRGALAAADMDRDGDLDIFVAGRGVFGRYPQAADSFLLRNTGFGGFEVETFVALGLVTGAVWTDIDNDGWVDLALSREWDSPVLLRNSQGKLSPPEPLAPTGWWTSINAGDIDNDGDIDLLLGNFGLNTKYQTKPGKPIVLHAGEIDGKFRLVEAKYEGDSLLPVRGRSCSCNAIPSLVPRFPDFHSFASASLQQIYQADYLRSSQRFEAETLESGVLINDKGKFTFKALPRIAQIAPVFGSLITDLDGDGYSDLFLAQNFFGSEPETGHFDGGLGQLLRGSADGTFAPVSARGSGIIVPDDGTAVGLLTAGAQPAIVIAANQQAVRTFHWFANSAPARLRLTLSPNAIGARVTVTYSDGSRRVAEQRAGSGYLSQSAGPLLFPRHAPITVITVRWPDGQTTTHQDLRTPLQILEK